MAYFLAFWRLPAALPAGEGRHVGSVATMRPVAKRPDYGPLIGLCCVALTVTGVALHNYVTRAPLIDFLTFYTEGRALLDGVPLYTVGDGRWNFNSPALTAFVFAPLALLPYPLVLTLWFLLSVAGFGFGVRTIGHELGWSRDQTVALGALILLTHGSFQTWAIGQLTFPLLFYPMTRAWIAYRRGELVQAGAWLAPAIVAKPPLALAAILLPVPVWLTAGTLSAGMSALTVFWTGLEPWRVWLEIGSHVGSDPETAMFLSRPFNVSLWGLAARLQDHAATIGALHPLLVTAVLLGGVTLAWLASHQTNRDRRFLCAGLFSTLLSPLGWAYYLPLVAGPAAALWTGSWSQWLIWAVLVLPIGMEQGLGVLIGSTFCFATLAAWWVFWPVSDTVPAHAAPAQT